MSDKSTVSPSASSAFAELVRECRSQSDSVAWAFALLKDTAVRPEDLAFFVQSLSAASEEFNREILTSSELPRCSFCLKPSRDVHVMVSSPSANICYECTEIARRTIAERRQGHGLLNAYSRLFATDKTLS